MFVRLKLSRFKKFQQLDLELRAMTVLTGANGGGKTSVLQALLLTHQAERARRRWPVWVQLNGPFGLALGEAQDVLARGATEPVVTFELVTQDGQNHAWSFAVSGERALFLEMTQSPETPVAPLGGSDRELAYLCAERVGPRDSLGTSSADVNYFGVGCQGEFAGQVLAVLDRRSVSQRRCRVGSPAMLRHQAEAWMSYLVRPIQIQANWFPSSSVTQILFRTPGVRGEWTRPPNMGFGISYALPIVVGALLVPPGGLLMIENPEAHLHPAAQSRMGAFLAQVAGDGVQVFVETHSDHVLNGIRRAAAVEPESIASEEVIFHFFAPNQVPVQSIEMNPSGNLTSWPDGFFDQLEKDLSDLASIRRRRGGRDV